MAEAANISYIGKRSLKDLNLEDQEDSRDCMIKVDHVSMVFNMANEKLNNLKEYVIAIARRELMFKEFRALEGVSFEVRRGDVFGILGTNGSGKSTLLKIVAGVLEPSEGSCTVNGKIAPLIELGAGFDMDLTARENIYLNGALLGYSRKFIDKHFDEIVEFAEVERFLDMPLKNYSSGMVARIAFSIATVIVPEILIVDEVLSVGDFMFQQKCERRISDLIKNHGVTVLIVSHSNDQIERLCNKAIWIEKGHTRIIGEASEVCNVYRAVGGRQGSAESESRIVDLMSNSCSEDEALDKIDFITGDNRYSTEVAVTLEYNRGQRHAIVVGADFPEDCLLATALAGATDAIVYNTKQDLLPGATVQAISTLAPDRVTVIGPGERVGTEVEASIREIGVEQVSRIGRSDPAKTAIEMMGALTLQDFAWGDTLVLAAMDATSAYVPMTPEIYAQRMAVLLAPEEDSELTSADLVQAIKGHNFSRLIALGGDKPVSPELVEAILGAYPSMELVEFYDSNPVKLGLLVTKWVEAQRSKRGRPLATQLVFTTSWQPVDAYLIGPYADAIDALVVIDNPENMDNTAEVIDFINSRDVQIDRLVFLGGLSRFNKTDRLILAKAAVEAADKVAVEAATEAPDKVAVEAATKAADKVAAKAAVEAADKAATEAATEAATKAATEAANLTDKE